MCKIEGGSCRRPLGFGDRITATVAIELREAGYDDIGQGALALAVFRRHFEVADRSTHLDESLCGVGIYAELIGRGPQESRGPVL